jgi:hypothetical protein
VFPSISIALPLHWEQMGADIMDLDTRSGASSRDAMEYVEMFDAQLTSNEILTIRR